MKNILKIIKNKKILAIGGGLIILILIFLFVFLYQLNTPLSKNVKETIFIIKEGEGLGEIAKNLRKEGLINNKLVFFYYVWLKGKTGNLQAGNYNLSPSMTISEIVDKIINGEVVADWIKVTIPEGWTNKQIEERLTGLEVINPKDYDFYRITTESYSFLSDRPLNTNLQGYLFPDTYYFYKDSTAEDIVKKMLDNFGEKMTEDLKEEIEKQDKTVFEIITMASILEREVRTYEDMRIVSGIFWKRVENNYPLESCATIAYILGKDKWRYSYEDTRIESPYNTYINIGLPPSPINNPGLSAIKAAIYPEDSDYNFFLSDPETGKTIFSKTLEEHNQNKVRYFE